MTITKRFYTHEHGYSDDFYAVRDFISSVNKKQVTNHHFMWSRWTWAFARQHDAHVPLEKMCLWEENQKIVGVAVIEDDLGITYLIVDPSYNYLKEEMLNHVVTHMQKEGEVKVLIDNNDRHLGQYARSHGFKPIEWFEENAVMDIDLTAITYALPDGYKILSFDEDYDVYKHNACLWHGFNHDGMPPTTDAFLDNRRHQVNAPYQDPSLLITVVAPNGDYAAYCGMWYKEGDEYAEVEPVCTHPDYRKLGLGKAVVLEGVKRCGLKGAKVAYVGSKQQFYYNIGFNPVSTGTMWLYQHNMTKT